MHQVHNVAMPQLPDAEQLLTLLAVAEAGSESAAAAQLGVGQSSVSRRLAALQQLSHEPLTQRTAGGTRLTAAGTALLGAAREVRAALREASLGLDPRRNATNTLRCGVSPHLVARFGGCLSTSAQAGFELVEAHSQDLLDAVRHGELPAVITLLAPAGGEPGLRTTRLGDEQLVLATHPSASALRLGVGPSDVALASARWLMPAAPSVVGERARLLLRRAGLAAVDQTPMPSPGAVRAGVLAGAGVGVVLRSELQAEAAAGWLTLTPIPFAAEGDDSLPVWLHVTDSMPANEATKLSELASSVMRG